MPTCPMCARSMIGGGSHGDWPLQYECHYCNVYLIGSEGNLRQSPMPQDLVIAGLALDPDEPDFIKGIAGSKFHDDFGLTAEQADA